MKKRPLFANVDSFESDRLPFCRWSLKYSSTASCVTMDSQDKQTWHPYSFLDSWSNISKPMFIIRRITPEAHSLLSACAWWPKVWIEDKLWSIADGTSAASQLPDSEWDWRFCIGIVTGKVIKFTMFNTHRVRVQLLTGVITCRSGLALMISNQIGFLKKGMSPDEIVYIYLLTIGYRNEPIQHMLVTQTYIVDFAYVHTW